MIYIDLNVHKGILKISVQSRRKVGRIGPKTAMSDKQLFSQRP